MGSIGITLLMGAAFSAFVALAWRKLSIAAALQAEPRWDDPLARLRCVVTHGFLQSRMIHGDRKAGVMHSVIFAGFLALLAKVPADRHWLR